MKTRVAVAVAAKKSHTDPPKQSKDKPRFLKNLTVPLVIPLFLVAMLALWWWSARLQQQQVEAVALEEGAAYVQFLQETAGVFSAEPGTRVKSSVSALLAKPTDSSGRTPHAVTRQLYIMEPLSGQGKNSEGQDEFIRTAWTTLAKSATPALWRFEDVHGRSLLRYAVAWKEGETKGILEVLVPLDQVRASFANYRFMLLSLCGGIGFLSLCFMTLRPSKAKQGGKASAGSHSSMLAHGATEQDKSPLTHERELRERKQHEAEIFSATDMLTSVTENLLQTTNELASSAAQMAAALTQTTTTVEEVQQTAALSSEKAQQVLVAAQNAAQVSQAGKQATEDTVSEMHKIHEQMRVITESIQRLSEQSQTVRDIIDTANDLAEQSNVLAVNAAIEAQKAGVHSGGFVIVAQEVRSLAQQSKDATTQVQEILTDIEHATDGAVQNTAQGAKAAEAGMHQSVEAGEAIRLLSQSVQESAQSVAQIAASSQQQMLGIEQLVQAVRSMQEGNTQTVTGVQQLETCIQRLQQLDRRLLALRERLAGGDPSSVASEPTSIAEAA
jgi:Methyl-accepting chemotaxis protein (MCP) signalling domain